MKPNDQRPVTDPRPADTPEQSVAAETHKPGGDNPDTRREYETSGCYPAEGKPFRMWALFGWLTGLIVVLAAVAALLNFVLLDTM